MAEVMERQRRAFSRRMWRRRWLNWRIWLATLVGVGLLAATIWAVWFSEWLSVDGIEVSGAGAVPQSQIREVADVDLGSPLIGADTDAIAARVRSIAAVRTVEVSKQWPDTVLITVTERVPVARLEIGDRTMGLDQDGIAFTTSAGLPAGLPRVVTPSGTATDALREAAAVTAALPDRIRTLVDHLEVVTADKITLDLKDGRLVVWGSSQDSALKADVLAVMLDKPGVTIDVSVPGSPTTSNLREQ
ncbi:MAG: cell division protein FtsQ/DivIB [Nocardioides sp.]